VVAFCITSKNNNLSIVTPRTFRGTRDFLPGELLGRRRILAVIEEAYRRYGFQPLETPAIEYLDILTGKSEENDKLIYEIKRARGEEEDTAETAIALRYDLTVPLARVVAQYAELPRPFKRYQIQPVWRADRPQPRQGRFREFVQCDADIVGTDSLLADAEIIALTYEVLRDLGFEKFRIRLSSRKFLFGLSELVTGDVSHFWDFCRCLDKLDKIDWEGVEREFTQHSIPGASAREFVTLISASGGTAPDFASANKIVARNEQAVAGIAEVEQTFAAARELGVADQIVSFDATLARGLDYYTGPIFETVLPDYPHIGSLSGGGRYDGLVQTFSKERVPATGTTIGLDRIQTALTQLGKFTTQPSLTQVLVARFDTGGMSYGLKLAAMLREAGIHTEVWYDDDRMKKQFGYADKQGIPVVVLAGPDERSREQVAVKDLRRAEQKEVALVDLVSTVRALLNA
jgi:histidyl-tRNA synthetase